MHPLPLVLAAALAVALVRRWRRLGWALRIAGVLAGVLLVVYGSGLVEPPDVEEVLLDVGRTLGPWTYLLVGTLAFLETAAFVGLVAPGEMAVIAGGVIAGQGEINVVALLLLVWACCVAGDSVSFLIGHRLGRNFLLRYGPRVKITRERLEQVEGFFARHGGLTILVGRFIGLVRALAPFVAGASRMRFSRFLPFDVVGSGLWASVFTMLGYLSWRNIDRAAEIASRGSLVIGTLVALAVAAVVLRRRFVARARHNERGR
jgi:undecaprenyl-diphosphatase